MTDSGGDLLHPIRVVARRTGLNPELIRAWERRYRAVVPVRGQDNQRLYSDADVRRLALLRQAVEAGRKIGRVATLDDDTLADLVEGDALASARAGLPPADPGQTVDPESLLAAACIYDDRALLAALTATKTQLGPSATVRILGPLLARAAEARRGGRIGAAEEEHLRSVLRVHLAADLARALEVSATGPLVLVAAAGPHPDELASLTAAAAAAAAGWQTAVLSEPLPHSELTASARASGAAAVVLGFGSAAIDAGQERSVLQLRRRLGPLVPVTAATLEDIEPAGIAERGHRLDLVPIERLSGMLAAWPSSPDRSPVRRPFLPITSTHRAALGLHDAAVGGLVLEAPLALRQAAHEMALRPAADWNGGSAPSAGELGAGAVLHAFWYSLLDGVRPTAANDARLEAVDWLDAQIGRAATDGLLDAVIAAGLGAPTPTHDRAGATTSVESAVSGLVLRCLAGRNPALRPLQRLAAAPAVEATIAALAVESRIETFLDGRRAADMSLLELALVPERAAPESLEGQLEALLELDAEVGVGLGAQLRLVLDLLREERRPVFSAGAPPPKPALPRLGSWQDLTPRYSPEREWMADLVLQAKHVLVWLDQLSRDHGRSIRRLDEVPDAELARLAQRGISGLWLVGIWRRSGASKALKRRFGQPGAAASAYALDDYVPADELGGEAALGELSRRALSHGIRLGADVVANHMGLDSRWVLEHPERFVSVDRSPFPAYSFDGPDLSPVAAIGLYLADQYRDGSDAPVVFRRLDRRTGEERFIYHGNDGTGLPWNDTAQLDFLRPETREAMIRTIVGVAQRVPILRLDAAMTLVREHIQRLWYPLPGAGGAIPSRAEHGLAAGEVERRMPQEFWREVVERVTEEAPDTLLLAEAFWLLEGYFVRSLGAHRAYNSAVMHLLRDEDNVRLRSILRELLAFDPRLLARFANYLTTPDERPAVEQFGKGNKYFGAATVVATLPGLPLIGHGQFEGLTERYGMEYVRPAYSEGPDLEVVARHEREIVPLLRQRHRFAGVGRFRLLDLERPGGGLDDDVLAWTTGEPGAPALVVLHNRAAATRGRLRRAAPFRDTESSDLRDETLLEALGLAEADPEAVVVCRDRISGLRYAFPVSELAQRGWPLELGPHEYRVLDDLELVEGDAARAAATALAGRGTRNLGF